MHPASIQKILTLPAAIDVLSKDYEFTTSLYKRGAKEYVVKLGADPYLTHDDLSELASKIDREKVEKIYIDDFIIEQKSWGEGWQWDDDLNTSMPRFNSYNLDGNLIKLTVMPSDNGMQALIINPSKYPIVFLNNVTSGDKNELLISRDNSISENALMLSGTVNTPVVSYIPISNLKRYFGFKFTRALEDNKIYLKQPRTVAKLSANDKLVSEIQHPISNAIKDILLNSNNMVMETVMKIASAKAYNQIGSDILGTKLFDEFCAKNNIDNSKVRLVDASGVSKNNLVYADFVTEYLVKLKDNEVLENMAKAGEGTLSNRMLPIGDNLRAKTGTLSDISSIAGYLTTKSGKNYAFCIMINDPKTSSSDKKSLEDYLIRELYIRG
jgi:D-alanyl-D-alanine carboxypeptidase/D-alanyl-D-alanine-endopeptidase (penicillin-binding protein 4)